MEFTRADKTGFDPRSQLSGVFVEGFYPWLKHFSKDKDRLKAVFAHVFNLEKYFVAVDGKEIAAMAALTQGRSPIALDRKVFVKELGFVRGSFAYFMLSRNMVRNGYPFTLSPKTGSIEFVATAPDFRNQGLAKGLLGFIMAKNHYTAYVLEVADTNISAVKLYESLGFREIKRVKAPRPKRSGVNFFLYMRRNMEE